MVSAGVVQVCALLVLFGCFIQGSVACFIRNCPPGGKRSFEMDGENSRECMSCGPGNRGQCVGPHICCGQEIGCYFRTSEASVCAKENDNTTPCAVRGDTCGARGQGNCVADGVCCDTEACSYNRRCLSSIRGDSSDNLVQLVRQLLRSKNYD